MSLFTEQETYKRVVDKCLDILILEISQCHVDGTPTSRLTSAYNKIHLLLSDDSLTALMGESKEI